MKTTIDIPEDELRDALKYAKAKTKREAILTALIEYNRRKRMAELVRYSAASDTFMSNEDLESLDREPTRAVLRRRRRGLGTGMPLGRLLPPRRGNRSL